MHCEEKSSDSRADLCAVISSLADEVESITTLVRSDAPPLGVLHALRRLERGLDSVQTAVVRRRLRQLVRSRADGLRAAVEEIQELLEERGRIALPAVGMEDADG